MTVTPLVLKPIIGTVHRQRPSAKRSVVKAVTYGLAVGCLGFAVLYLLTKKTAVALGFIVVSNIYTTVCYYIYERIWARIAWGKVDVAPAARRRRVHSAVLCARKLLRTTAQRDAKETEQLECTGPFAVSGAELERRARCVSF
jgi:uncharacterized membrane protein